MRDISRPEFSSPLRTVAAVWERMSTMLRGHCSVEGAKMKTRLCEQDHVEGWFLFL